MTAGYFYDSQHTRYRLVKTNSGHNFNWLFFPGGPGADSSYLLTLAEALDIPGNLWLIDLPANGNNLSDTVTAEYDFNNWFSCFVDAVARFENVILVGHSFGGMLPLLLPEIPSLLTGFVMLNAASKEWLGAAEQVAQELNLPSLAVPLQEFVSNPSQASFHKALIAHVPYYFTAPYREDGSKLLEKIDFNYHATTWFLKYVSQNGFDAKWIPANIPTLVIGGAEDAITPFIIIKQDSRFQRENINIHEIANAGHFPWLERMKDVKQLFANFVQTIQ